jgi:hypothetical protein
VAALKPGQTFAYRRHRYKHEAAIETQTRNKKRGDEMPTKSRKEHKETYSFRDGDKNEKFVWEII